MPWSTGHRRLEEEGKQRIRNGSGRSASDVFGYKGTFSILLPLLTAIPTCWSYSPSTPHNHTSSVYPRTYRTDLHTYALTQFIPPSHFYPSPPLPPFHHPSHTHSITLPLGLPSLPAHHLPSLVQMINSSLVLAEESGGSGKSPNRSTLPSPSGAKVAS